MLNFQFTKYKFSIFTHIKNIICNFLIVIIVNFMRLVLLKSVNKTVCSSPFLNKGRLVVICKFGLFVFMIKGWWSVC